MAKGRKVQGGRILSQGTVNAFYAHFETSNTEPWIKGPAVQVDCVITLSVADVSKTCRQVNIHKTAGPGGIPGRVHALINWQVSSLTFSKSP